MRAAPPGAPEPTRRSAPGRLRHLLNVQSYFSFGHGVSSPTRLVDRAAELGYHALALTDLNGVYGAVEAHRAARHRGMHALIGATVRLRDEAGCWPLPLLSASRHGYAALNELLTIAHQQGGEITPAMLEAHATDLHALTGGRAGFPSRLLAARRFSDLERLLERLGAIFPDRLWVQLYFGAHPGDRRRGRALRRLAQRWRLPAVAAPEVRYATRELHPLYDALTCARLGITVDDPHPERPQNDAAFVPHPDLHDLTPLPDLPLTLPDVLANTEALAEACRWPLLPDRLIPPKARVPEGLTADEHLERRAWDALRDRYRGEALAKARARLDEELATVRALGFAEFFLATAEVTDYCHARGIVASGRGSAAASILCYLLDVTQADPIEHDLLFERFLHGGKTSPPDIDVDIASGRRDEVLAWVERRFGARTEAMVCNRITYYLPSAVQDLGRALGIPPDTRDALGKALGRQHRHRRPHHACEAEDAFREVLGDAPVLTQLLGLMRSMEPRFVRHVAPHAGGVVLSREPLAHYSPIERSSGGLKLLQFDKDDAPALGLVKLDLLGLRMLGVFERTREEVYRLEGRWLDVRDPPHDPEVWRRIREGDTMGLFQIESPGQVRLSTQLRPRTLTDLAHQVALFRPGPIQSDTVHPYVARRNGREPVTYLHPSLEPVLAKSYGVILFQEDLMRIAVHVAGMSWSDAERFRKKVTTFEDEAEIRDWHHAFVEGAMRTRGCTPEEAQAIFDAMAAFRGYGFAESHAWAFGLHAYVSAWLRHHHPAPYLAAVMTEHPGMWPLSTLRQEARRWGVDVAPLCVNASGVAYRVERGPEGDRIRPPLHAVKGVSDAHARQVVMERARGGPYRGVRDLYHRLALDGGALEALARAGAFDALQARRDGLFEARALHHTTPPGRTPLFATTPPTPPLEALAQAERIVWDYELKGMNEAGVHPVDLMRRELLDLGVTPMAQAREGEVRLGGLIVARQKPQTAKGFAFFVIEDGTDRVQVVITPDLWDAQWRTLRDARMLVVDGVLHRDGRAWTLRAHRVVGLEGPIAVRGYHYAG
ncbi:MAG: DNA polymerase III subunit alpha [Trueperaceae bacterium]|nr:DNA polymerase III subunit alpha [Trueperaceae bacterium]